MSETIVLEPVDKVEVRTLVDNQSDMLLRPAPGIVRPPLDGPGGPGQPMVEAPLMLDSHLPDMLIAEHGFSALVSITKAGRTRHLLFDAGLSTGALVHNMDVLQIPIADIEAIVMSHGHFDHIGGLHGLLRRGVSKMPMLLHPDFWLRRRIAIPGDPPFELPAVSKAAMQGSDFEIIEGVQPSLLLDGSVLITGEVDRTTEFEKGFAIHQAWRDDAWTADPLILDDQALIASVPGHGLIVLTGCGHSGIVNIVRHAQKLTGETKIAAIIGGFHLNGPLFAPLIDATVAALTAAAPGMLVPGHCTGFEAVRAFSLAMPDAFVVNSVGTKYVIEA